MKNVVQVLGAAFAIALVAAACSDNGSSSSGGAAGSASPSMITSIGTGEGQLNLIAWPGYTQPAWVKPFETDTGCQVNVKPGNTSDEMVNLMRQQGGTLYDGVSASGDATLRLIAGGDVQPIDTSLFPDYADVMQSLQAPSHNTVNDVHYGVPYMWGPNLLMYNTDEVSPPPDSWNVVFESTIEGQPNPYAGHLTAYDSAIYIADAALYLKAHNPELGITDPYELTSDQLDAAVNLLTQQNGMIQKYWSLYSDEVDGFNNGDMWVGTAWPVNQQYVTDPELGGGKVPVDSLIPSEGVTGWADTWMMSSHAQHPNCMLMWMDYTLHPDVQTAVAEFYGATPSSTKSCAQLNKDLGEAAASYHCGDDAFLSQVALWKTPLSDCGNGDLSCTDYNTWTQKWLDITGG